MYSSWHDYRNNIEWNRTGSVTLWQDARTGRFFGATHYYEEPSWLPDSSGALLFEETNALTAQVVAAGVGADHNHIKQWFHDSDTKPANEQYWKPIGAGELSPARDRLAVLRGGTHIGNGGLSHGSGNTIALYGVHLPTRPSGVPDHRRRRRRVRRAELVARRALAGMGRGRRRVDRRDRAGCAGSPRLTIPGAREPDWGPAGVGAASPPRPASRLDAADGIGDRPTGAAPARAEASRELPRPLPRHGHRPPARPRRGPRDAAPGRQGRLTLRPARVRRGRLSVEVSAGLMATPRPPSPAAYWCDSGIARFDVWNHGPREPPPQPPLTRGRGRG